MTIHEPPNQLTPVFATLTGSLDEVMANLKYYKELHPSTETHGDIKDLGGGVWELKVRRPHD